MSTVINRTTLAIRRSAHTPDYPVEDWIINPVFPDCSEKYYKIDGDEVLEMDAAEKTAVDNVEAAAIAESQKTQLINNKLIVIGTDALISDGVLDESGDIIP